jgi:hypothetical protein
LFLPFKSTRQGPVDRQAEDSAGIVLPARQKKANQSLPQPTTLSPEIGKGRQIAVSGGNHAYQTCVECLLLRENKDIAAKKRAWRGQARGLKIPLRAKDRSDRKGGFLWSLPVP